MDRALWRYFKRPKLEQQKRRFFVSKFSAGETTGSPGEKCDRRPVLRIYQKSNKLLNLQIIKVYMGTL